ncbi:Uncharacterized protein dnm_064690 [Desulfonema magnum]|uniref:Uncharacterized protein n=1 Tax=Desulfonema magnum TaxID=45655 RepID=A0A975BS58_9BACT|nr:Uncharacterized protein dnm_064690 [Desulfonema magnum]
MKKSGCRFCRQSDYQKKKFHFLKIEICNCLILNNMLIPGAFFRKKLVYSELKQGLDRFLAVNRVKSRNDTYEP